MKLDFIKDNIILVVPNSIKNNILLYLNNLDKIYNIKIMSLDELIKRLTFNYDKEAIYYLMSNYNIKYDVSCNYLNNIKYIENKDYNNKKLNKLVEIKEELISNNLLIYDKYIDNLIENKEIIIYGYDYISKYDLKVLNNLNVNIIKQNYKDYKHDIFEFDNIDEEVEFVSCKIVELLKNGIDISNIKITGFNDEYYNSIKRIFSFYNIPINLNTSCIYGTNIIKDFLHFIKDNDINKSLDMLKNKYDLDKKENNYIYNKLINILNSYNFDYDNNLIIDILINDLKNTNNIKEEFDKAIEIIDLKNNIIDDEEYIFILSFNQNIIPHIYKDEDYINDNIKLKYMETTMEKNKIERDIILNKIRSIKNLVITYKLNSNTNSYIISSLNDELNFEIKHEKIENKYSNKMNYINLAKKLDNLVKYNIKDNELDILYNNYSDINYLTYNNKFSGINKDDFNKFIDNKLLLSFSSIDNYYRCSFRYYLNNILKLNIFEDTIDVKIGNIFHYILSICFNDGFDLDKEYDNYIKNIDLSISEMFFIKKLKEDLRFVIETIKDQNKFSTLNKSLYENKIYINKDEKIKLTFMGIIDKLLYKEENSNTYLVIIDYKTGTLHTNLNNVIYGINMQLPVYLYISKEKFKNAKVIGFYLQKILNNKKEKANLKLDGYSINNTDLLSKFDFTYKDSEVIKSMKINQDGSFSAYSKILSEYQMNKLNNLVKENIENAFNNILDCNFNINPKVIGKNLVGCEYCKYKDICFKKEEDKIYLEEKTFPSYLDGGDNNE